VVPGVAAAFGAAEPLAVVQVGAGEVDGHPALAELADGFAVVAFGVGALGQ
jgi:hypothetical protein